MTPAERAATLYTVQPVAGGWAIYGPAWTIIDDCFATREEAEREIQVYAARTIEAIAAAERDAYSRGVADGVAGLRNKLVEQFEPLAEKHACEDLVGRLMAGALRAVIECVKTARVEP